MLPELEAPTLTQSTVEEGKLVVNRVQDVEPILERAKSLHNEGFDTTGMGDKHAATLPFVVVEAYCNANGITFQEWCHNPAHVKRMLNDPSLSGFRIWKGQV